MIVLQGVLAVIIALQFTAWVVGMVCFVMDKDNCTGNRMFKTRLGFVIYMIPLAFIGYVFKIALTSVIEAWKSYP